MCINEIHQKNRELSLKRLNSNPLTGLAYREVIEGRLGQLPAYSRSEGVAGTEGYYYCQFHLYIPLQSFLVLLVVLLALPAF